MRGHDRTDLGAGSGHDVDDTLRHAGFLQDFAENERGTGAEFRGLYNRGAAGRQRERQLLTDNQEREIPGRDDRHDTDRLTQNNTERAVTERIIAFAMQISGKCGGITPDIDGTGDFTTHLGNRLSGLDGIEIGKLLGSRGNEVSSLQQNCRAFGGSHARPWPGIKSGPCRRYRPFRISLGSVLKAADDGAMAGCYPLDRIGIAFDPLAIDKHLEISGRPVAQHFRIDQNRHHHSPLNIAGRFAPNAATPSFRSPVLAASMEPNASTAVPLSSPLAEAIISLTISDAAGPRAATRCA